MISLSTFYTIPLLGNTVVWCSHEHQLPYLLRAKTEAISCYVIHGCADAISSIVWDKWSMNAQVIHLAQLYHIYVEMLEIELDDVTTNVFLF